MRNGGNINYQLIVGQFVMECFHMNSAVKGYSLMSGFDGFFDGFLFTTWLDE